MSEPAVVGTYDPQLITLLDMMRNRSGDIGPVFLIPDVTYEAQLRINEDWRLATAAILDSLARIYDQNPTSFSMNIGLSLSAGFANQGEQLRAQATRLRQEVQAESSRTYVPTYRTIRRVREDDCEDGEYRSGLYPERW